MTGPEHFTRGEQLLEQAADDNPGSETKRNRIAQAHAHFAAAQVAAYVEAAGVPIHRPHSADPDAGEPAYPGNPWGRALFGQVAS